MNDALKVLHRLFHRTDMQGTPGHSAGHARDCWQCQQVAEAFATPRFDPQTARDAAADSAYPIDRGGHEGAR